MQTCTKCPLCRTRTNVVVGEGYPTGIDIMVIGEAPGETEDLKGLPFQGASGKLLRSSLERCGFDMSKIYITNVVKCRPPSNRNPSPEEINACLPYLEQQIRELDPKILITVGRIPLNALIPGAAKKTMTQMINGSPWKYYKDILKEVHSIYHPAYILRQRTRQEEWESSMRKIEEYHDERYNIYG